jgi:uroporphyrin-III C-methyltransferase
MGVHNLDRITHELNAAGMAGDTPVALVRWGTTPQQQELIATLGTIVEQIEIHQFTAPAIAVIGNVVKLQHTLSRLNNFQQIVSK